MCFCVGWPTDQINNTLVLFLQTLDFIERLLFYTKSSVFSRDNRECRQIINLYNGVSLQVHQVCKKKMIKSVSF